jgi:hypothetical protein
MLLSVRDCLQAAEQPHECSCRSVPQVSLTPHGQLQLLVIQQVPGHCPGLPGMQVGWGPGMPLVMVFDGNLLLPANSWTTSWEWLQELSTIRASQHMVGLVVGYSVGTDYPAVVQASAYPGTETSQEHCLRCTNLQVSHYWLAALLESLAARVWPYNAVVYAGPQVSLPQHCFSALWCCACHQGSRAAMVYPQRYPLALYWQTSLLWCTW